MCDAIINQWPNINGGLTEEVMAWMSNDIPYFMLMQLLIRVLD